MRGASWGDAEERIASVLARRAQASGYETGPAQTGHTPLAALLQAEAGPDQEDEHRIRVEAIGALVDFILQDGPHPGYAMKNFYAVVHALRPQALPNWTCDDFAQLFGQTKAAHSWRVKKLFGTLLEAKGGRGRVIRARFQKSATATAAYSQAQKGNTNRRHGHPRVGERAA